MKTSRKRARVCDPALARARRARFEPPPSRAIPALTHYPRRSDPALEPRLPDHPPLEFRGRELRGAKLFADGAVRGRAPGETLEAVRPLLREYGVTRLANITGLDCTSIPAVVSIRPAARSMATTSGKGLTLEAAMTSAAMEAIEVHRAEHCDLEDVVAPYAEIAAAGPSIAEEDLPLARHSLFHRDRPERWCVGWDAMNGVEVAAPRVCVTLEPARADPSELVSFVMGSNGLASGATLLEAILSGLLECIERDAVACAHAAAKAGRPAPRVRLETVEHAAPREALERVARAGVKIILQDCTSDVGVPAYAARLYDERTRHVGVLAGYGAHLDPGVAMLRAITEAVQARLVYISGSRDDFFRNNLVRFKKLDDGDAVRKMESREATADARERVSLATGTFEGDVGVCLARLRTVGLERCIVFDLAPSFSEIGVARVVVPGLEGYMYSYYRPGRRALAATAAARAFRPHAMNGEAR